MLFGVNVVENIDILARRGWVIFFLNVAGVTMDLNDGESIDFRALGGADASVVGDLSGTDVTQIGLDLCGPTGSGYVAVPIFFAEQANDRLILNGLGGADAIDDDLEVQ